MAAFGAQAGPGGGPQQEHYQLRTYNLRTGPQLALTQGYFERALIPALNRLGMSPVGTFKLDIGPETPTYYVLIPSTSVETLLSLDNLLGKDPEYVKGHPGFGTLRRQRLHLSARNDRSLRLFQAGRN